MKCVLEFGAVGGRLSENTVLPTVALGAALAARMAYVLGSRVPSILPKDWEVSKSQPRMTWTDGAHFVALSILDGADRGPASARLWKGLK